MPSVCDHRYARSVTTMGPECHGEIAAGSGMAGCPLTTPERPSVVAQWFPCRIQSVSVDL